MRTTDERDQLFEALFRRLVQSDADSVRDHLAAAGVLALRVPDDLGGLDLPVHHAEPVMAALGEACRPASFLECNVVAAGLLRRFRTSEGDAVMCAIVDDGAICAVAGLDPRLSSGLIAEHSDGTWSLHGTAKLVLDGGTALAFIAIVATDAKKSLFLLRQSDAGKLRVYPTIDGRFAADLHFDGAPAQLLSDDAGDALELARDEALACIAVEAAGVMRRLVRDTAEHARQRRQFGKSIAEFQVVQHRLVDMHIQTKRAGAIARRAVDALLEPPKMRSATVSAAKATVVSAGRYVGQQAVQLHGAMGMTEELPISRGFKRLTVIEGELGSADAHLRRHAKLTYLNPIP